MKLDKDGVYQWTYQAGEAGSASDIRGVAVDTSSNVVIVGNHKGSAFGTAIGNYDIVVVMPGDEFAIFLLERLRLT